MLLFDFKASQIAKTPLSRKELCPNQFKSNQSIDPHTFMEGKYIMIRVPKLTSSKLFIPFIDVASHEAASKLMLLFSTNIISLKYVDKSR